MESSIYDRWDREIDTTALQNDVDRGARNRGTYRDVPAGTYEVKVEKMELIASKKGDPMVSIWFRVVAGQYRNNRIFYNQVIKTPFGLKNNNNLLKAMELRTIAKTEQEQGKLFKSFSQYANLLMDCAEEIDSGKLTFQLEYGENDKGFHTFEIADVFEN